jgi:hypothetical protein
MCTHSINLVREVYITTSKLHAQNRVDPCQINSLYLFFCLTTLSNWLKENELKEEHDKVTKKMKLYLEHRLSNTLMYLNFYLAMWIVEDKEC